MDSKNPEFTARSFFKVLMPGFDQKLNLPPAVSKELEKCKSKKAILESRIGRWRIDLCKNSEDDLICFQRGWPEFVRAHSLSLGDFLVIHPTKRLHFTVSVFDSTAWEKEFPDETKKSIEALDLTPEDETSYFVMKMQPRHGYKRVRARIPTEFMRANQLGKQRSARLRDPRGREWTVRLAIGGRNGLRQSMEGGWRDFCTSNDLHQGHHICVFKLISKASRTTVFFDVHFLPA